MIYEFIVLYIHEDNIFLHFRFHRRYILPYSYYKCTIDYIDIYYILHFNMSCEIVRGNINSLLYEELIVTDLVII